MFAFAMEESLAEWEWKCNSFRVNWNLYIKQSLVIINMYTRNAQVARGWVMDKRHCKGEVLFINILSNTSTILHQKLWSKKKIS